MSEDGDAVHELGWGLSASGEHPSVPPLVAQAGASVVSM
jgi:hypothetical protein